ncbi:MULTISPECIES: hypothetical protein [Amycolatopsis]|uniref:ABC-2 type transport system permease protein n=2 Tax=Amycolatopsis TaxID=1813 RepID=A0A1I4DKC4_9PSEU|nr:hypothetical protein [Amycolatopsis sacchari]SFK92486.1 hypothetical protein SAMN05421835_14627 [Amycolatopsis sacchari]
MTARLLRAELMRLPADHVLLGFVAMAVVLAAALALGTSSDLTSGLAQVEMVAMLYGTLRFGTDNRNGVVARSILLGRRGAVLVARGLVAALGGAVIGVVGGVCTAVTTGLVSGRAPGADELLPALPDAVLAAAVSAVLGLCFGVVVRNYFLAPVAAFLVHVGSAVLLESVPVLGQALPFGATMSLVSPSAVPAGLLPHPLAAVVLLMWLALAGGCTWQVLAVRDVGQA